MDNVVKSAVEEEEVALPEPTLNYFSSFTTKRKIYYFAKRLIIYRE